ncbi:hypothetical protein FB45DRAFT_997566 [Roridomyces roridus]|uniref:NTF2-like protein n=1 Tax=Roridomyces roridus TaxID=1738132 RepID=A0AAD7CK48_9AGAR|nr:hypothetical protein FB45DRAFT_997566 [Roridomyces roridus]
MFSSPTPAPGSRALASNALRGAGLMTDRDATMRDVSDRPTGRKPTTKHRPHRAGAIYDTREKSLSTRVSAAPFKIENISLTRPQHYPQLSSRISADPGVSDLSIRGASRSSQSGTRPRRNAVSGGVQLGPGPKPGQASPSTSSRSSGRSRTLGTVEHWTEVVKKRYDPQTKCLNLDSMSEDNLVRKYNLQAPGSAGGTAREAGVIFKLASRLQPPVETLSLANNALTGQHLSYLDKYLPQIVNLSLRNNNLRQWKDVDSIAARRDRLLNLRELILSGNPLREQEYKSDNVERYKRELSRRFTTLDLADGEPIAKIAFDVDPKTVTTNPVTAPSATSFPFEMGPSFIDGVDPSLVSTFLSRFFPAFDNQRPSLGDVYTPGSTFSYCANTSIPARARVEGVVYSKQMPNQRKLEWTPWLGNGSRNLSRLIGDRVISTLHTGSEDIVQAIIKLPLTKHDILGASEKFCVDAFLAGVGLLVVVHGEFVEAPSQGVRSFDRTFILAPAPEGSRAKQNGWDVVILSDQWTIRGFSKPEAWAPGPMRVQTTNRHPPTRPSMPALPPDQQALLNSIPDAQRPAVLQICSQTGLNVKYSMDCLNGNGWDHDRAVANFNQVKATLPPDAFLRQ